MMLIRPAAIFFVSALLCCLVITGQPPQAAQKQSAKQEGATIDAAGPPLTGYLALLIDKAPAKQYYLHTYWQRILEKHDPEAAFGSGQKDLPSHHLAQWKNLSAHMSGPDVMKQLRYINGFFNNFPSRDDQDLYGREDYWATPEEFMANRAGDCEDYAVAKYLALRYFGWPAKTMWLLVVRKRNNLERHAVLAVANAGRVFILDNLSRPAYQLVPEKTFLTGFVPLFAINENGFWYFAGSDVWKAKSGDDAGFSASGSGKGGEESENGVGLDSGSAQRQQTGADY